jgi:hypothetical protein
MKSSKIFKIDAQTIGNLLAYYDSDLTYINNFQRFMRGEISEAKLCDKQDGTFYSFLIEYKIARNFKKNTSPVILQNTVNWINGKTPDDVDGMTALFKKEGLTRGRTTVLSSKVLFLNNPWEIIPMDINTKKALGLRDNTYSPYLLQIDQVRKSLGKSIDHKLSGVENYLVGIERQFRGSLRDVKTIRHNRFIDKLLWVLGKENQSFFNDYAS